MLCVRALYKHVAEQPEDLSFQPGDLIRVLDDSGNWWKGECEGRIGKFPKNYVMM